MPIPKVPLILTPTPIHRLDKLSEQFGVDLWIKRDDLTGFALGGNKGRKLEYMIADALNVHADVVVTCGGIQSNFVRQLGAACSRFGLRCAAAVMELPYEYEPVPPTMDPDQGNALLDRILGVDLIIAPNGTWEELYAQAEALAKEYEAQGKRVYRVPIGGSSPLGAYAFYQAAHEIKAQTDPFDWIVTASSSGSTQTGLTYGFLGTKTKVLGVVSDPEPEIIHDFAALGEGLAELIGAQEIVKAEQFLVDLEHVGPGYGVPSEKGNNAIDLLARKEGVFLDPIYSGKAFAALLDRLQDGQVTGRVLFWHTGGIPALFAMPS